MCNNAAIATEAEKGLSLRIHDTPTDNYDSAMIDSLIPTDEHEKGPGKWDVMVSIETGSVANSLRSGFASVRDVRKTRRCR